MDMKLRFSRFYIEKTITMCKQWFVKIAISGSKGGPSEGIGPQNPARAVVGSSHPNLFPGGLPWTPAGQP